MSARALDAASPDSFGHAGASGRSVTSEDGARTKVQPDGRACPTCQAKDSDPDRVLPHMTMKWGYAPDPNSGRNVGRLCYYCHRVWTARFKQKYKSLDSFTQALGGDLSLVQVFQHWLNMGIGLMQELKRHDIKISWGDEATARQVTKKMASEVRVEEPEDVILAPEDYRRQYGDPASNGLGHRYVEMGSAKGYLIPGAREWRVKRARVMSAELSEVVDDGSFQLGHLQMEGMVLDIAAGFAPERATGVSLSDLLPARSREPQGPDTEPASSIGTAPPTSSTSGGAGLVNFFALSGGGGGVTMCSHAAPTPERPTKPTGGPAARVPGQQRQKQPAATHTQRQPMQAAQAAAAAQSPQADSGQARRGRPKEDAAAKAERLFEEFSGADQGHVRFFGAERRTQIKSIGRLIADLEAQIQDTADTTDTEALTKLQVISKKTSIVMSLVKAPLKTSAFAQAFQEVVLFARMAPAVEDWPCPIWLHQLQHTQQVQMAKTPAEFWQLVTPAALEDGKFAAADVPAKQSELVAARVVDETRVDDGTLQHRLRAFSAPDVLAACALGETVARQLRAIYMLSTFDDPECIAGDLQWACGLVNDSAQVIAAAICTFPAGRKLLAAAQDRAALLERRAKRARYVGSLLSELDASLPAVKDDAPNWRSIVSAWDVCDAKLDAEDVGVDIADEVFVCLSVWGGAHQGLAGGGW